MDTNGQAFVPKIESRWVFVSTSKQAQLAAVAASYMAGTDKYVAFFEFPSVDYLYTGSSDFGTDGYFARVMGDRVAINISNALVKIQPEAVVLLGLTEIESGYLRAHLPDGLVVQVQSEDQLLQVTGITPSFAGEVLCRPSEIVRGLLKARFERKRLTFSDTADSLPAFRSVGRRGLFAIEDDGNIEDIAAVNLAFSCDLDVVLLPPISKDEVMALPREMHEWVENPSHHAYQSWKRRLRNVLRTLVLHTYEFVTFFTRGVPYGLFTGNAVPCSHVFKYLGTGPAIVNAIIEERKATSFGNALLFSPQLFSSDETKDLNALFHGAGYDTKPLLGSEATVKNLSDFGSYYPYDVLHICSHGGETEGYFATKVFRDREGAEHTVELYEVVGFAPAGGEMVRVHRKLIFHKFDGQRWMSAPLKGLPQYIFEDMMRALKSNEGILRVPYSSPIALSCHIQCHSSIHQGDFDQLAGFGHPIVFNNTCSSSHELALSFLSAGARCYIGTLWRVGNETAKQAATDFYMKALKQGSLLDAFHHMLGNVKAKRYVGVYVFWGFQFSSLPKPQSDSTNLLSALMFAWHLWLRKVLTTEDQEVKRNSLPVIRFIGEQILGELDRQELANFDDFDVTAVEEIERSLPALGRSPFSEQRELDISEL